MKDDRKKFCEYHPTHPALNRVNTMAKVSVTWRVLVKNIFVFNPPTFREFRPKCKRSIRTRSSRVFPPNLAKTILVPGTEFLKLFW
jgi:hypothetical protein